MQADDASQTDCLRFENRGNDSIGRGPQQTCSMDDRSHHLNCELVFSRLATGDSGKILPAPGAEAGE